MSTQLVNDEKIIQEYEYAGKKTEKKSASYKTLTVTTKRIVQEECHGRHTLVRNEMPIYAAQNVSTALSRTAKTARLVWAIIVFFLGLGCMAGGYFLTLIKFPLPEKFALVGPITALCVMILGLLAVLLALILLISYFTSRRTVFYCLISGDVQQTTLTVYGDTHPNDKGCAIKIEMSPNRDVAKDIVNSLGSTILYAQEYEPCDELTESADEGNAVGQDNVAEATAFETASIEESVAEETPAEEAPAEESPVEEATEEVPVEEPAITADAEVEEPTTEA